MYEPVSAVMDFVTDNLESSLPHILVDSDTGARLGQEVSDHSLMDLGLVPVSLLNFYGDQGYLRSELKQ